MRLASKIFGASTLVVLALVGVAAGSLLAVDRLVRAHREISDQSIPALQLEVSLQETVPQMLRLEVRYLVLKDRSYGDALQERVDRVTTNLERLNTLLRSEAEQRLYREVVAAFAGYRAQVSTARTLLGRGAASRALTLSEGPGRAALQRFDDALTQLAGATSAEVARAETAVRTLETRTWTAVLVTLSVSLVAAVGAIGFVAFRLTRSVRRLSAATRRVADGSFRDPLPVETRDEIGDLTRAFNGMAEQLQEVESLKQHFFAQVSHELRNPLTAIRGSAQLLLVRTQNILDANQRRCLQTIDDSVDRLLHLVNRILDFNRLRAGVFPLERQSVAFDKVVARALDVLAPQAEREGRRVEESAHGDDFVLLADEEALTQIVFNLVGNAIKFTPEGGAVHVTVTDEGTHVALAVRDTGPGIPLDAVARIFEPYRQVQCDRKGAGLGLAIVKELVGAHGGSIRVDTEEGKGACFIVRLPKAAAAVAA